MNELVLKLIADSKIWVKRKCPDRAIESLSEALFHAKSDALWKISMLENKIVKLKEWEQRIIENKYEDGLDECENCGEWYDEDEFSEYLKKESNMNICLDCEQEVLQEIEEEMFEYEREMDDEMSYWYDVFKRDDI